MNFQRLATALTLGLIVSGSCTWILGRKMSTHAAVRPDEHYMTPARAMDAGDVVKPEDLETVNWPASNPLSGAFSSPQALLGRTLLYPVGKGQPFTDKMVTAPGAGSGLAAKIPEGMRAVALRSDEIIGVAGFLQPASHVDVIVTVHPDKSPEPVTFTVVQNAEVLAAGKQYQPEADGKPTVANVVTLLLTPEDAERAVLASQQGTIHLVLRNGADKVKSEDPAVDMTMLMGKLMPQPGEPAHVEPAPGHKAKVPAQFLSAKQAPNEVTVETISGDKTTSESFQAGPK